MLPGFFVGQKGCQLFPIVVAFALNLKKLQNVLVFESVYYNHKGSVCSFCDFGAKASKKNQIFCSFFVLEAKTAKGPGLRVGSLSMQRRGLTNNINFFCLTTLKCYNVVVII